MYQNYYYLEGLKLNIPKDWDRYKVFVFCSCLWSWSVFN